MFCRIFLFTFTTFTFFISVLHGEVLVPEPAESFDLLLRQTESLNLEFLYDNNPRYLWTLGLQINNYRQPDTPRKESDFLRLALHFRLVAKFKELSVPMADLWVDPDYSTEERIRLSYQREGIEVSEEEIQQMLDRLARIRVIGPIVNCIYIVQRMNREAMKSSILDFSSSELNDFIYPMALMCLDDEEQIAEWTRVIFEEALPRRIGSERGYTVR